MITKRTLILFSLCIPVTFLGSLINREFIFFFLYNFILLLLILADYKFTPGKALFVVNREVKDKFFFGTNNEVVVKVGYAGNHNLRISVKDCFDSRLDNGNDEAFDLFFVKVNEEISFKYTVKPYKRGRFAFHSIFIRYDGLMGLCRKVYCFKLPKDVKVYPNITPAYKYRSLVAKNEVSDSRRRIKGKTIGTIVESLREYEHGDEFKKINWSATARHNKLISSEYDIESNQNIVIMLDCGRTMGSVYGRDTLMDWALSTAVVLADIANFNRDKVGFMAFDNKVRNLYRPGQNNIKQVMDSIYDIEASEKASNYKGALVRFSGMVKKRSMVCLFTNFNNEAEIENLSKGLDVILKRHSVMIVMLRDPFLDSKNEEHQIDLEDDFNKTALAHILKEKEQLVYKLKKKGVAFVYAPPHEASYKSIIEYLNLKAAL